LAIAGTGISPGKPGSSCYSDGFPRITRFFMPTPDGVDADGFILLLPQAPLQPEFAALIDDACNTLSAQAADLLDGIYLYGSIASGKAARDNPIWI